MKLYFQVKFTDGAFCVIFGAISGGMEFNTGGVVGGVLFWSFEFVVTLFDI